MLTGVFPAVFQPQEADQEDLLIAQAIDQELQSAEAQRGKRPSTGRPQQHILVRTALQVWDLPLSLHQCVFVRGKWENDGGMMVARYGGCARRNKRKRRRRRAV